jgi:hypothetical protein
MSSGSPVESVRRAFALLEELNRQRINSVQHLHEVTALPKSTAGSRGGSFVGDRIHPPVQASDRHCRVRSGRHGCAILDNAGKSDVTISRNR